MKKVPSYLKLPNKSNMGVSSTLSTNINSPKSILQKKGYKNELKKLKI
jgi:hypothetical protein